MWNVQIPMGYWMSGYLQHFKSKKKAMEFVDRWIEVCRPDIPADHIITIVVRRDNTVKDNVKVFGPVGGRA